MREVMEHNCKHNCSGKKYAAWIPAAAVMVAIFWFSAQPADVSTEMSDGVTRLLLRGAEMLGLMKLSSERVYELCVLLSTPVRKCAHITEYLVLYLTVLFALHVWGMRGKAWYRCALFLTVAYACTDEFHQVFVPGRAGRLTDVMIDSIGAAVITAAGWRKTKKADQSI